MTERLAISIKEAAEALGISLTNAYAAAKRGDLPTVQFGGRKLVPVAALNRILLPDVTFKDDFDWTKNGGNH